MRIDPTSVFFHTIRSLPIRLVVVWLVGILGAFTPLFFRRGFDMFGRVHFELPFFPFYLLVEAVYSGGWGFVGFPLLLVFVRDGGCGVDVLWLYLLPVSIALRESGEFRLWTAAWAVGLLILALGLERLRAPDPF